MSKINYMPMPLLCDVCKGEVMYVEFSQKFAHMSKPRIIGQWRCRDKKCGALVSCHVGTKIPVGYMAKHNVREMRVKCHEAFDLLWSKSSKGYAAPLTRESAYTWMANILEIERSVANISKLSIEQMEFVIEESLKYISNHVKLMQATNKSNRQCTHDKKTKQRVLRQSQRKTEVKIDKRNYHQFEV